MKIFPVLVLILVLLFIGAGCTSNEKTVSPSTTTTIKTPTPTTQKTTAITTTIATTVTTMLPPSPTKTVTGPVCESSKDTYNCADFPLPNGADAYDCYNYCKSLGKGDVHKLDRDGDGWMCER